jgi:hypothetical protein
MNAPYYSGAVSRGSISEVSNSKSADLQPNETVEKVSLQQMTSAKWEKTIENCPVFGSTKHNSVIFEPEVGDFCTVFSGKGFFDSLNGSR